MKNLIKYFLFGILLIVGCNLFSQNPTEDFKKINQAYMGYENLSMNIDYRVYNNHTSLSPIDQQYGEYKKKGDDYFNKLMGFETLVTNDKMLMIDTSEKQITIKPAKKISNLDITGVDMEKILKMYKRIEFVDVDKNRKGYKIYFKDSALSPLSKMEVYYSENTFLIEKMILFYRVSTNFGDKKTEKGDTPRLEINFSNIKTNPSFAKDEFSFNKYIKPLGMPKTPTNRYKNFQIIELKN